MRLAGHVTLNCNNNMFIAAIFLDTGKVVDKTWYLSLPYKLLEFTFSITLIKLITFFFSQGKFGVSVG
jgi:hypothetical protein